MNQNLFIYIFLNYHACLSLDVLPWLSDVILLRHTGKDGGQTKCSGVARHRVHPVHCSGKNQRGMFPSLLWHNQD